MLTRRILVFALDNPLASMCRGSTKEMKFFAPQGHMFNFLNLLIMVYVTIEIETPGQLQDYLKKHSWSGAKDRVDEMSYEDCEKLFDYLNDDQDRTQTEINDLIWFDWDDIKDNNEE